MSLDLRLKPTPQPSCPLNAYPNHASSMKLAGQ
jgi:hypothetical protein